MARAIIGIVSIGDMGLGIAKLLKAHGFRVVTNATGRSAATLQRARENSIELVADDLELCNTVDIILSILPPAFAVTLAENVVTASNCPDFDRRGKALCYLDLNAISPARARHIEELLTHGSSHIKFIDGGIIGAPPKLQENGTWRVPSIPLSGPIRLSDAVDDGEQITKILNARTISPTVGTASGLKMCFASLSKGFTALAIQSYSTASNLGVLAELQAELDTFSPGVRTRAENGLVSMPPKAYRWVDEMREIAATFELDGGFSQQESPFRGIAEVYDLVANDTVLRNEKVGQRSRGQTAEDVASLITEGTRKRKEKSD
ncbi:putative 6-phosphogluconate dehydrogenase, NADP-binding, 6-phosphogluconate dehydrogenase, domain 2 [Septoria linicola]|nr:putative 6-phosphogluconate dehydrogenase, NADP-binding, 6-phosphogluconate dehydrogenase, domain 2 [Septoria linicola]